jgi:hypothetical protein
MQRRCQLNGTPRDSVVSHGDHWCRHYPRSGFRDPAVARVDTRIKVYGNCTTPSIEPTEIVLACADYGVLVEGLRWTSWTAASAMAVGTLVYNDCTPNCAEGHYHHVPGTRVILTVPSTCQAGRLCGRRSRSTPNHRDTGPARSTAARSPCLSDRSDSAAP